MYDRCRQALRLQLELIAEPDSVYSQEVVMEEAAPVATADTADTADSLAAEKKEKVAAVMARLEDVVRLLV
ncbi:hypothetical protein E4U43_006792 [Claviceps pusilla]|uniref:Uncharacterized protein n=1 Tax=Claviceps pusilla TaxID=123648 RepID=A0A9P7N0K8_9HYPO|nr:hypothetical protein E4U43_006792 [Claviceps pusilla]